MKPLFLTDIDGVVLDYDKSFYEYLQSQGVTCSYVDFWDTTPFAQIQKFIYDFNHSEAFEHIDIFSDALEILPRLSQKFELVAITTCGTDPLLVERRHRNLQKYGIEFAKIICLPLGHSKLDTLCSFPPSIWIEDQYKNALHGIHAGHQTFLRKDDFTPSDVDPNIRVIQDWFEMERIFLS